MYGHEVLARIAFIKKAQVLGFALEEIGRLIRHKQAGENPCEEVREIVSIRLKELDERIKRMKRFRSELTAALRDWEVVGHADGHVCGLIEQTHVGPYNDKKNKSPRGREQKQ
jgi:DNA-binding transcriptional MerR regulator